MKQLADTSFIASIELVAALSRMKPVDPGEAETIRQAIAFIDRTSTMLATIRHAVADTR